MAQSLRGRGWVQLYHNVEVVGVQVDLLLRNPQGLLVIIEVKSQTLSGSARLTPRQRQRLGRVASLLAEWEPVEMTLALVLGQNITLHPLDGLTVR